MSDDHTVPPLSELPRELVELEALALRRGSRAGLSHDVARFRLALTEVEYAALAVNVRTESVRLLERSAAGRTVDLVDTRELMAFAIAGRLEGILAPYLYPIGADLREGWQDAVEEDLAAIAAGEDDEPNNS